MPGRVPTTCWLAGALLGVWAFGTSARARAVDAGIDLFERRVRPMLVEHCYRCHSAEAKKVKGGLRLDTQAGWRAGGDSGRPAIVPGAPDASPLIRAIRHAPGVEAMPPSARLPERVIADVVAWVKIGA